MKKKPKSKKVVVGFGSSRARFSGSLGVHPGLDPSGTQSKKTYNLSPGQYDVPKITCSYKEHHEESWRKKLKLEEWSANIGYTHPTILIERQLLQSIRGPGAYDVNEDYFKHLSNNAKGDNLFGKQKRFQELKQVCFPPPGTYTGEWVYKPILTHKQITTIPPFEWDGFVDRFRGKIKPWQMPPNIYNIKDGGGIDALISKKVSLRGPYDLFTGPRDGTTIKNHFSPSIDKGPEEYFKMLPNELEKLLTFPSKKRCGKFLKNKRWNVKPTQRNMLDDITLCYRDPKDPGPGHYDILKERTFKQNLYPFNQSVKEAKPGTRWKILPGVGRYNPKYPRCKGPRKSWVFLSKIGRPEFKAVEYNAF